MSSGHYLSITQKHGHLQIKALNASLDVLRKCVCRIDTWNWDNEGVLAGRI